MSAAHHRRQVRLAGPLAFCLFTLLLAAAFLLLPSVAAARSGARSEARPALIMASRVSHLIAPDHATFLGTTPNLMALLALQQSELTAPDGADLDEFGYSVAISGNTALVGDPYCDEVDGNGNGYKGTAFVFARSGTGWTQEAELAPTPSSPWDTADYFGNSVAIDGNIALVEHLEAAAIPTDTSPPAMQRGAVYVFVRSGLIWTQQAELIASDGVAGDQFGSAVALCCDVQLTALIGANGGGKGSSPGPGGAYVFTRSNGVWDQQAELIASDRSAGMISAPRSPSTATRPWWEARPTSGDPSVRERPMSSPAPAQLDPAGQTHRPRRCRR